MFFIINFGENMAKRYSIEERKNYCAKWQSSANGLGKNNFCKTNNISESALHKWLKLYGDKVASSDTKKQDLKFLKIESVVAPIRSTHIEIMLPNGLLLKAEVESLSKLIQELSR
jgi:hypothetical protein